MTAAMAMFPSMPMPEKRIVEKKDTSHLRKRCKSCKQFHGTYCSILPCRRQQDQACEKYEHK